MAPLPTPHDKRSPRGRGDDGAAVVEFALLLPVFVMLLFGIIEVSRGYNAKVELTTAVREAARAVALRTPPATPSPPPTPSAMDVATAAVTRSAPGVSATVTQVIDCAQTPMPANAEVTATYDVKYSIPLVPGRTWKITVKGVMRCGL